MAKTKKQSYFLFAAAVGVILGVGMGILLTEKYWGEQNKPQVTTKLEKTEVLPTVANKVSESTANVEIQIPEDLKDKGLKVLLSDPKVSFFEVGSSTYVVFHYKSGDNDFQSAVSVYVSTKSEYGYNEQFKFIYSDVAGSCGQPFSYGVEQNYFAIRKNINPCEAMSQDWIMVYNEKGELVVEFNDYSSIGEHQLQYRKAGNDNWIDVKLLQSADCSEFKVPEDLEQAEKTLHTISISGFQIGNKKLLFPKPVTQQCTLSELNELKYAAPGYWNTTSGTHMLLEVYGKYRVDYDVLHPELVTIKELGIKN